MYFIIIVIFLELFFIFFLNTPVYVTKIEKNVIVKYEKDKCLFHFIQSTKSINIIVICFRIVS